MAHPSAQLLVSQRQFTVAFSLHSSREGHRGHLRNLNAASLFYKWGDRGTESVQDPLWSIRMLMPEV